MGVLGLGVEKQRKWWGLAVAGSARTVCSGGGDRDSVGTFCVGGAGRYTIPPWPEHPNGNGRLCCMMTRARTSNSKECLEYSGGVTETGGNIEALESWRNDLVSKHKDEVKDICTYILNRWPSGLRTSRTSRAAEHDQRLGAVARDHGGRQNVWTKFERSYTLCSC